MYTEETGIRNGVVHCPECDSNKIWSPGSWKDGAVTQIVKRGKASWVTPIIETWGSISYETRPTPNTDYLYCEYCEKVFDNPFLKD